MNIVIGESVTGDRLRAWCLELSMQGYIQGDRFHLINESLTAIDLTLIAQRSGVYLVINGPTLVMVDRTHWRQLGG